MYGALWRLTPRDLAALHAYELLHQGLYQARHLPVRRGERRLARHGLRAAPADRSARAKPGYVEAIAAAARVWDLPEGYVRSIERWSRSRFTGARVIESGRDRMNVVRHIGVRGRVQGVGFRAFVEHEALKRGIERLGAQPARRLGRGGVCRRRRRRSPRHDRSLPARARSARASMRSISARASAEDSKLRRPGELFSVLPTA